MAARDFLSVPHADYTYDVFPENGVSQAVSRFKSISATTSTGQPLKANRITFVSGIDADGHAPHRVPPKSLNPDSAAFAEAAHVTLHTPFGILEL